MNAAEKRKKKIIAASAAFIIMQSLKVTKKPFIRHRRQWMNARFKRKDHHRDSDSYLDIKCESLGYFEHFTKLSATDFEKLIEMVGPKICKQDTYLREAIPVRERLSVTLRFLATGDSYTSLSNVFTFSKQIISKIVPEVCQALVEGLCGEIKIPASPQEWMEISSNYSNTWNFPHCLGAIDGKHIVLKSTINSRSGSDCSIVLMALVDANYKFIYADMGCQNRISDNGVFKNTKFYNDLETNSLHLPQPDPLPTTNQLAPYVFVADDAYPLMQNVMKPYAGSWARGSIERSFNYRLNRVRHVVENVFGIMSSVFGVLRKPLLLQPEKAGLVVMACVYMHNFLRNSPSSVDLYSPMGTFDEEKDGHVSLGSWRNETQESTSFYSIQKIPSKSLEESEEIRNIFAEYCSIARLPWQDEYE